MKNVYGSKEYIEYIKEYFNYLETTFKEYEIDHQVYQRNDYRIEIEQYNYQNKINSGVKTLYKIFNKNSEIYHASSIQDTMEPSFISISNTPYVIFRKTLFGFTLLNLKDQTEYNFYPQTGLKQEAFIVVKAWSFKDILIFEGCYWGSDYGYYFFQVRSEKVYYFSNHCDEYFSSSCTVEPQIQDDEMILTNDDGNSINMSYEELCANLSDNE